MFFKTLSPVGIPRGIVLFQVYLVFLALPFLQLIEVWRENEKQIERIKSCFGTPQNWLGKKKNYPNKHPSKLFVDRYRSHAKNKVNSNQ